MPARTLEDHGATTADPSGAPRGTAADRPPPGVPAGLGNAAAAALFGSGPSLARAGGGNPAPFRSSAAALAQTISNAALAAAAAPPAQAELARRKPDGPVPRNPPGMANPTPAIGPAAGGDGKVPSGIDWGKFWEENKLNLARTGLEVGRIIPGWGALSGIAADSINAYQDFEQIKGEQGEDVDLIRKAIAFRSIVGGINNFLGHIAYVDQLVQDVLVGSVVGAEFAAITAPIMEGIKGAKLVLDSAMLTTDVVLTAAAHYKAANATGSSKSAWEGMAANYEANVLGDIFTLIVDVIDVSTAGLGQAETVKQGTKALKNTFSLAKIVKPMVQSVLQGWFGVWGGKLFEKDGPVGPIPTLPRRVAGQLMMDEIARMKLMYTTGDRLIGMAGEAIEERATRLRAMGTQMLGGKDPVKLAQDTGVHMLQEMSKKAGDLERMQGLSKTAAEKAEWIRGVAEDWGGRIDALRVPDVKVPKAEFGDNVLADAAEGVVNAGGDAVNALLEETIGRIRGMVEAAKASAKKVIGDIKRNAAEIGEFLQLVQDTAKTFASMVKRKSADLAAKLAKCRSFEDFLDLILGQISEIVGADKALTVADIRAWWKELGTTLDDALRWAQGVKEGREDAPPPKAGGDDAPPPGGGDAPGKAGGASQKLPGTGPGAGGKAMPGGAKSAQGGGKGIPGGGKGTPAGVPSKPRDVPKISHPGGVVGPRPVAEVPKIKAMPLPKLPVPKPSQPKLPQDKRPRTPAEAIKKRREPPPALKLPADAGAADLVPDGETALA